ncbi:ATP-binding protein [Paenibacillus caui]|uniref:ATP-binding protein n=1 Tax=Paenibacillus caui TaxID=2873927 RepID=UPI001CA8C3E2|nr:ATP-binding protein [Paenibacillus caui]
MTRDLSSEIDVLKKQMADLQQLVHRFMFERNTTGNLNSPETTPNESGIPDNDSSSVFYSGHVRLNGQGFRWEPQQRLMDQLLELNSEKAAKVLAALGNKQRLDILRSVLNEPLSGSELVDRLNMGTTGQLYHHLKALIGADLLVQEHGGRYAFPNHRCLPFLLLLAAVSDLLETSDYLDMMETRNNAGLYFGTTQSFDAHHLLWAVVENSLIEHQAGFCSDVDLFLHDDGGVTVTDNGRGIPVSALPSTNISNVQSTLTDINRFSSSAPFQVPGAEKGITIAVVNALSQKLTVEIRRDGKIYRQEYRHGIPQSGLLTVGISNDTGTSVTFKPDPELFGTGFERTKLDQRKNELLAAYPNLSITFHD